MNTGVLIVGACQAGVQMAASLREGGYEEPIALVGDEKYIPYQRPPLSKAFLLAEQRVESVFLRAAKFFENHRIDLLTGERIDAIDIRAKQARTSTGRDIRFNRLVFATGAAARRFPGSESGIKGVVTLRDIGDALALRSMMLEAQSVVVLGGGFIGLECASAAHKLGKKVTLLEVADRLMARSVAVPVSDFYAAAHRRRGIAIEFGVSVARFEVGPNGITGVGLADGRVIPADLVIAGVGGVPRDTLAVQAGIECSNGILVDEFCRTSMDGVMAIGDCTVHRNLSGRAVRLESVQNAIDQAKIAALGVVGRGVPYSAVPWFWSEQDTMKLQIAGLAFGHDHVVLRGSLEQESFSALYFKDRKLIAVDSINRPADHLAARKLLAAPVEIDYAAAADANVPLKSFIPAAS